MADSVLSRASNLGFCGMLSVLTHHNASHRAPTIEPICEERSVKTYRSLMQIQMSAVDFQQL